MARDRKRAKQRRARGAGAAVGRRPAADAAPNGAQTTDAAAASPEEHGTIERADLPGALDHAGAEVDEFDAALIRGAGGVPLDSIADEPRTLSESEIEQEADVEDALQEPAGGGGTGKPGGGAGGSGGSGGGGDLSRPSGAPLRGGNRAIGFLRASWAELQRVQWPDRRQVTQATAVVLGFVAIAGLYLGAADYVAKEIVEFIL